VISGVELHESFFNEGLEMAFMLPPRGHIITLPSNPRSVAKELPPTVDTNILPLGSLYPGSARGVKHIAAGIRRLSSKYV
jgi:hypothetical protein